MAPVHLVCQGVHQCQNLCTEAHQLKSVSNALPALLLQRYPDGLDALTVNVKVAVTNARGTAVLNEASLVAGREVELHVINELQCKNNVKALSSGQECDSI